MSFTISECTDADFTTTLVDIIFEGMHGRNNFINAIRPHNETPEGREKARLGYLRVRAMDPSVKWIKATDPTSSGDKMIGVAMWNIYYGTKPPEKKLDGPPGTWDSDEDKEWAVAMYESFIMHRRTLLREAAGPVVCLNIMAVADEHQRRGAGLAMARWGTAIADAIGAECSVESTAEGKRLYEKAGFVPQLHYLLEVPAKFRDRPQQWLDFMVRPRTATT